MNTLCFCSVIFPNNLKYLPSFLKSLKKQTDLGFTLLLFNDGVTNHDLNEYLVDLPFSYKIITVEGSIVQVREQVIKYLKESSFQYTVFGDSDDYFPKNRIAVNKQLLKRYDIVANDLFLVTHNEELIEEYYWKGRDELQGNIDLSSIVNFNFLGLGNTAIRNNVLPEKLSFDPKIKVIDWFLFSLMLTQEVKVCFTSDTYIYYRQHQANIVGRKEIDLKKFKEQFIIKLNHYGNLVEIAPEFHNILKKYQAFEKQIDLLNEEEIKAYISNKVNPFWWEDIQLGE